MTYKNVQFIAYCINTAPAKLESGKEVYLGLPSEKEDIEARIKLVEVAIQKAHESASKDESHLKIFMMPEFFFRGPKGAYEMLGSDDYAPDDKDKKYGYADIISGLQSLVLGEKWKDWIFIFGTIVAKSSNEKTPKEEAYNVSLVQKGGPDPYTTDALLAKNARVVMKEHKSHIDFIKKDRIGDPSGVVLERVLHPLTEGEQKRVEGLDALWLSFLSDEEEIRELIKSIDDLTEEEANDLFLTYKKYLKNADFWALWEIFLVSKDEKVDPAGHKRKRREEFFKVKVKKEGAPSIENPIYYAGTSIFEMDGIKFGLEVCLDHAYSRLKESEEYQKGERVDIQLIPSCGMSIKSKAIAVRDGGYVFNCDGIDTRFLKGAESTEPNNQGRQYLRDYRDGPSIFSIYDSHSALAKKEEGISKEKYVKESLRFINIEFDSINSLYPRGAGQLHIYPLQPLGLKFATASSLSTPSSEKCVFLNRMKITFDKPVSVYPVSLEAKSKNNVLIQKAHPAFKGRSVAGMMSDDGIGLTELFGKFKWVPRGGFLGSSLNTDVWKSKFEGLLSAGKSEEIEAEELMSIVPSNLGNEFEIESRTQRGFKFSWRDADNQKWVIWGHEPDAGAAPGYIGGKIWTVRIGYGEVQHEKFKAKEFLMAKPVNISPPYGTPVFDSWSHTKTKERIELSHIPLDITRF